MPRRPGEGREALADAPADGDVRCTIPPMNQTQSIEWRPQAFGRRNARDIDDPVIEPMWRGDRVVVSASGEDVAIFDVDGAAVADDVDAILAQLQTGILADDVVIDGY